MLKEKIFLIENSLSMSKGFLDHNLFHDPNVTTIHRDYPDNRAKDVRNSILWPSLQGSAPGQVVTKASLKIYSKHYDTWISSSRSYLLQPVSEYESWSSLVVDHTWMVTS